MLNKKKYIRPHFWSLFALTILLFSFSTIHAEAVTEDTANEANKEAEHQNIIDYEPTPIHQISAVECKKCHAEIYNQWKGSMHAQSTALKDPIHGAFYKNVMGDPLVEGLKSKKGKYPVCLQCHAPNAAQDGKTKLDTMPAYSEGVNCVVCHRLKKFKGTKKPNGKLQLGIKAYEVAQVCQGPSGFMWKSAEEAAAAVKSKDNPHTSQVNMALGNYQKPFVSADEGVDLDTEVSLNIPIESNPGLLKTSAACLGCHDQRRNSHGVSLCQTGTEYTQGKSYVTCQSCHMPVGGGFANHSMGGGHDLSMLRRAVVFELDIKKEGDTIKTSVLLKNTQPHNMPTGAPFRNMVLKVSAYGKDGNKIWQNYEKHPVKEDPQSYFVYVLLDGDGKSTTPPKAKSPGKDTRLKPYEKRTLNYEIPAKDVFLVRAELHYNLLWPGLVKKLDKKLPDHLKAPQLIAWSEERL